METEKALCKDKAMALTILETIIGGEDDGMKKTALEAVAQWVKTTAREDVTRMTKAEQEACIQEIFTKEKSLMTDDQRRRRAGFWLPERDIPTLLELWEKDTPE
jgi:hypothetical protein